MESGGHFKPGANKGTVLLFGKIRTGMIRKNGRDNNIMPRHAREKSETGIYHIMVRGINRQDIFHDADDYQKYLDTLSRVKEENHFQILGLRQIARITGLGLFVIHQA